MKVNKNKLVLLVQMLIVGFLAVSWIMADDKPIAEYQYVKFFTPINKMPAKDTIEFKDTTGITGTVVDDKLYHDGSASGYSRYIIVRKLENGIQEGSVLLPYRSSLTCFDIQVSPNGRYVMFKLGTYGDIYDRFWIYVWDLPTGKVIRVTETGLSHHQVSWSPSSKYIAYCEGGDMNGLEYGIAGVYRPLKLFVFDVKKQKSSYISRGQSLRYFTWSGKDTIFYNQTTAEHERTENDPSDKSLHLQGAQNIYETSAATGDTSLLIKNARSPIVSFDRSKILYYSSEEPGAPLSLNNLADNQTNYRYLCLLDTQSNKITRLEIENFNPVFAQFIRNNDQLIYCIYSYREKTGRLAVKKYDFNSEQVAEVAAIEEKDTENTSGRAIFQPQFNWFGLYNNEKYLIFYSERKGQRVGRSRFKFPVKLNAVDILSKNVQIICEDENNFSLNFGASYNHEVKQ